MTQTVLDPSTAETLAVLDAMFTQLYNLREYISTTGYTAASVLATLNSTGLGIGIAPTTKLDVNGDVTLRGGVFGPTTASSYTISSNPSASAGAGAFVQLYGSTSAQPSLLVMGTGNFERARIDNTSGGFLIGTVSTTPNPGVALLPSGSISLGNTAASSGFPFVSFLRSASGVGSITQSGTTAVLYNTTSDVRLKTAVEPLADSGAVIDAIRPVRHEFIAEPGRKVAGFIAQELHLVVPQAVHVGGSDPTVEPWGVDAAKLLPFVVRELQDVRARLTALEKTTVGLPAQLRATGVI